MLATVTKALNESGASGAYSALAVGIKTPVNQELTQTNFEFREVRCSRPGQFQALPATVCLTSLAPASSCAYPAVLGCVCSSQTHGLHPTLSHPEHSLYSRVLTCARC